MRHLIVIMLIPLMFACGEVVTQKQQNTQTTEMQQDVNNITKATVTAAVNKLKKMHPKVDHVRLEKGVAQAASLWRMSDGSENEFLAFCEMNFVADDAQLDIAFNKLSRSYEVLYGHFTKMGLELGMPLDLDMGEVTDIDMMFGSYDASAHLTDDLFNNKVAFVTVLNFPFYSLKEKTAMSENWSRKDWAYARMGDRFTSRVPAELLLNDSKTMTNSDAYISQYNIFMGFLINDKNETFFDKELKLITHWGLRDELKSHYATENGLERQQMIYEVMKRIIAQDIPQEVINSNEYLWNPIENKVYNDGKEIEFTPEPNSRYQHLLDNFHAKKALDAYYPQYENYIQRRFEGNMEIPFEEVEQLFVEFISSPLAKQVGELIKKRLGRDLEPFDIWYGGFKATGGTSEAELNKILNAKYPTCEAFEADLPVILTKLGFTDERAQYITSKVQVDASRGAGHAAGAAMRSDKAHLRTRIGANGMDYKGYNIAVHEFGHNVEQTISLYDVDYYSLNGVPNTAFTEALAFIFQKRDLELLGMKDEDPNKMHMMALNNYWSSYEIMGVSLVDMYVWKWLYENPNANAEQLKEAVISIAKDVWNKYYAPVFGIEDQPILAIYSHMIDYPLYLAAYPLGHLIDFQIEQHLENKQFAEEVDRIYKTGRIIPQAWMKVAVGEKLSNHPMFEATKEALKVVM